MNIFGIECKGDHWVCFNDEGVLPGRFDMEAARWGSWPTTADIERINGAEGRLINMEDIRACIREREPANQ